MKRQRKIERRASRAREGASKRKRERGGGGGGRGGDSQIEGKGRTDR